MVLDPQQILFGVHSDGVMGGLGHIDRYSILQKSELLEFLGLFQR